MLNIVIAHNCIRQIVYKINTTPVKSFADKWLPIFLRTALGSAVHDFIQQNSKQFTELEICLKVPSIRFSGKADFAIGSNVLGEIKSCTYDDYAKIHKTGAPRDPDFMQLVLYKYILENYLEEIKSSKVKCRSSKPKYDHYEIERLQFIYISHDILTQDIDDFGKALHRVEEVKKKLG